MNIADKNKMSEVSDNCFFIFKEIDGLFIYGESLEKWLSMGAILKEGVRIHNESERNYLSAKISPTFLYLFIFNKPKLFEINNVEFGYSVRILQKI